MYADPIHIRDNAIKVRLNDVEYAALIALANLNGMQPAVFVRELALSAIPSQDKGFHEDRAA